VALPKTHSAEGGSNGTTVTTGNSGGTSGNAFEYVTIGSGAALIYDNTRSAHGTLSVKGTQAASPAGVIRVGWEEATGQTTLYGRLYVYRTANPTGDGHAVVEFQTPGVGVWGYIHINTSGILVCTDSAASAASGTTAIQLNAWNRIEFKYVASTTVGVIEAKLFTGDASSPVDTVTKSGGNTGASATTVMMGQLFVSDASAAWWVDDLQVNGTAYPGPLTAPQYLRPTADSVVGAYTTQAAGTTDLYQTIDETTASDADYVQSALAPSSAVYRFKLGTGTDPSSSTGHVIRWRVGKSPSDGQVINATIRIYQGGGNSAGAGTLIKTATRNGVTSFTTYEETLSGGEADTITNYADLYGEIVATQA
jgi:hypothetical protein